MQSLINLRRPQFDLSPFYVGLLFGLKDGANSLASPIWGWACDRYHKVKLFILFASCFAFTSFFLLGPFPGVPIQRCVRAWFILGFVGVSSTALISLSVFRFLVCHCILIRSHFVGKIIVYFHGMQRKSLMFIMDFKLTLLSLFFCGRTAK